MVGKKFQVQTMLEAGISDEIEETGSTLEENSALKAHYVFERLGIPVISDDSGLEVDALNGEPGVYSARYAGIPKSDDNNTQKLLQKLGDSENRKARFRTVLTYLDKSTERQFEGVVEGTIIHKPRGNGGFRCRLGFGRMNRSFCHQN